MTTFDPNRPRIAISMGDPGGVGPEVIAKALCCQEMRAQCRLVIIGSSAALRHAINVTGCDVKYDVVSSASQPHAPGCVPVVELPNVPLSGFQVGAVSGTNGKAAHAWIVYATELAMRGEVHGICTAPISKEAMFAAGFDFPGHTELLARTCGDVPVRMMLEGGGLHAVLQTIHVAIANVPSLLTKDSIIESLEIMQRFGERHMKDNARIAVCGLNPHAGEAGHFGREEIDVIAPAIEAARGRGVNCSGPYPADTVYHRALAGDFDLVLAMYHDQALIPVKTLDFHRGVNVTLGLPIVRTSPDHGTAFDIAGKGVANESSMVSALMRAAELCGGVPAS